MEKKEDDYSGFWKNLGCILSLVAILGIATVLILGAYLLFKGL